MQIMEAKVDNTLQDQDYNMKADSNVLLLI